MSYTYTYSNHTNQTPADHKYRWKKTTPFNSSYALPEHTTSTNLWIFIFSLLERTATSERGVWITRFMVPILLNEIAVRLPHYWLLTSRGLVFQHNIVLQGTTIQPWSIYRNKTNSRKLHNVTSQPAPLLEIRRLKVTFLSTHTVDPTLVNLAHTDVSSSRSGVGSKQKYPFVWHLKTSALQPVAAYLLNNMF